MQENSKNIDELKKDKGIPTHIYAIGLETYPTTAFPDYKRKAVDHPDITQLAIFKTQKINQLKLYCFLYYIIFQEIYQVRKYFCCPLFWIGSIKQVC